MLPFCAEVLPSGLLGDGVSAWGALSLAATGGTGLTGVVAEGATGTGVCCFSTSLADDPGRFAVPLPPDGDGVGVELDWLRGIAIFIRRPALSELITLNCCCLSVLCLLLVLLVEATDEVSESDDESEPSSESDEDDEDDEDERGDFPGGFGSTGVVFTVVMVEFRFDSQSLLSPPDVSFLLLLFTCLFYRRFTIFFLFAWQSASVTNWSTTIESS